MKKVLTSVTLLFLCAFLSIAYRYMDIGAFVIKNRPTPIYSVDRDDKKVAITFDTTWGAENTEEILDILDKYNIKATFFIVGNWAQQFSKETKEISDKGHEIGNHSDKHPDFTRISKERMLKEITAADIKIQSVTGKKPKLFRFPEGSYNDYSVGIAEATDHKIIQWDVDSIDWKEEGVDIEQRRVLNKIKNGSIILFHVGAKYTPKTLPLVIEKLKGQGYEFETVSNLIYNDSYFIDSTGKQISKIKH